MNNLTRNEIVEILGNAIKESHYKSDGKTTYFEDAKAGLNALEKAGVLMLVEKSKSELLPCCKCGCEKAEFWDGCGTQADLSCSECGLEETVQCCDVFDYGDPRRHAPMDKDNGYMNPQNVIDAVNEYLTEQWNQRATPVYNCKKES